MKSLSGDTLTEETAEELIEILTEKGTFTSPSQDGLDSDDDNDDYLKDFWEYAEKELDGFLALQDI